MSYTNNYATNVRHRNPTSSAPPVPGSLGITWSYCVPVARYEANWRRRKTRESIRLLLNKLKLTCHWCDIFSAALNQLIVSISHLLKLLLHNWMVQPVALFSSSFGREVWWRWSIGRVIFLYGGQLLRNLVKLSVEIYETSVCAACGGLEDHVWHLTKYKNREIFKIFNHGLREGKEDMTAGCVCSASSRAVIQDCFDGIRSQVTNLNATH